MGICGYSTHSPVYLFEFSAKKHHSACQRDLNKGEIKGLFSTDTQKEDHIITHYYVPHISPLLFFSLLETAPKPSRVKTKKVFQDIRPTWISCSPFAALSSIPITFLPPASSTPAPGSFPEGPLRAQRRNGSQSPNSIFGTERSRVVCVNTILSFLDLFYFKMIYVCTSACVWVYSCVCHVCGVPKRASSLLELQSQGIVIHWKFVLGMTGMKGDNIMHPRLYRQHKVDLMGY